MKLSLAASILVPPSKAITSSFGVDLSVSSLRWGWLPPAQ